jgi:hypothetical protein
MSKELTDCVYSMIANDAWECEAAHSALSLFIDRNEYMIDMDADFKEWLISRWELHGPGCGAQLARFALGDIYLGQLTVRLIERDDELTARYRAKFHANAEVNA